MPPPLRARATVCGPVTAAEAVTVRVISVPAVSEPLPGFAARLTVGRTGAASLSVMLTFAVVVAPSVTPEEGLEIVNVAVSGPSTRASSAIFTVTLAEVAPFGMVIDVGRVPVKSPAVMPAPLNDRATVWGPSTAAEAVAVRVITVPAVSDPAVGDAVRVTAGFGGPTRRTSTPLIKGFSTPWTKSMSMVPSTTWPCQVSMPPAW